MIRISVDIVLLLMMMLALWGMVYSGEKLALLSATLKTYQKAGCDTDQISLACPRGTSISVELAQFVKPSPRDTLLTEDLCNSGYPGDEAIFNLNITSSNQNISYSNKSSDGNQAELGNSQRCIWSNALQYSLLQTVVEACQKKKHCKFNALPLGYTPGTNSGVGDTSGSIKFHSTSISTDPCPRVRKFVEIAYKCRPYEFRSKVACENDVVQLECNPYSRIAVYSSSFGRTEYESIQCPQPQGVKEENCLASYATETVMQICHGRRRCNLSADSATFGSPCRPNSRMYLKVVYTCVPKQVLKDRFESMPEPDEPEHFEGDTNDFYDEDQFYKESEAFPKLQSNMTRSGSINVTTVLPPTSSDPLIKQTQNNGFAGSKESLYLYLLIAGSATIFLLLFIIAIRIIVFKKQTSLDNTPTQSTKGETTTIPNGFNDSISEIDADIDLTTIPVVSVSKNENYIPYGPTSSLYGSLGPSNVSHTSTTMLLPTKPLMCPRQSPDIIGVSSTFVGQSSHVNSTIGTIVPITSLSQYTAAPTFGGYILDTKGVMRRPISAQIIHAQQHKPQPSEIFHYDGIAPRTLSSGVPQNSQFYYG